MIEVQRIVTSVEIQYKAAKTGVSRPEMNGMLEAEDLYGLAGLLAVQVPPVVLTGTDVLQESVAAKEFKQQRKYGSDTHLDETV